MICPVCNHWRTKKHWKPSQWKASNPVCGYYNCCNECNENSFTAQGADSQAEEATIALHHYRLPTQEEEADFTQCVQLYAMFLICVNQEWLSPLQLFFECWVSQAHEWRKRLSYNGALKKTRMSEESHWSDGSTDYFDPGNHHYLQCHTALFGNRMNWSANTIGDITEGLLGYQWLLSSVWKYRDENFPDAFVTFIHDWNSAVFRYCQTTQWRDSYDDLFERIRAESNTRIHRAMYR